ncbi:MAG: MarR family transcriptional regulator [Shewanella sp.]
MSTDETQANRCLSDNVCFTLYTAGNALVRAYRPLLDECGLTYPQYLVMQALWLNDGISLTQLSQATHLGLGTLTPIVKRLETKDLLICAIDTQDERKKVIRTTPTGLALKQEALVLKQILLDKVTLSEVEIELLRKMCITLTQDLNSKE